MSMRAAMVWTRAAGVVLCFRDPPRTTESVITSGIVTEPGVGYGMPKANLIAKVLDVVQFGRPIWRMAVYNWRSLRTPHPQRNQLLLGISMPEDEAVKEGP